MLKCPSCGKENRETSRFCAKCGASLSPFLDYYAALQIAPDAPLDVVKQALAQAARTEPPPLRPEQLDQAIDTLTDPRRRADYDQRRLSHLAAQQLKKANPASNNFYERLGVSRFARRRVIQQAFDFLAHLARQGKINANVFHRLDEACAWLTDPERRRAYNQSLDATASPDNVPVPHEFNYYDYLGLDRSASEVQIRKADEALRGPLVLKAKTGDQSAEEVLRQLNQIIQTLTDDTKRKEYDADPAHDVFRFQMIGRIVPTARAARFALIESIVYGKDGDAMSAFGGLLPDDARQGN